MKLAINPSVGNSVPSTFAIVRDNITCLTELLVQITPLDWAVQPDGKKTFPGVVAVALQLQTKLLEDLTRHFFGDKDENASDGETVTKSEPSDD